MLYHISVLHTVAGQIHSFTLSCFAFASIFQILAWRSFLSNKQVHFAPQDSLFPINLLRIASIFRILQANRLASLRKKLFNYRTCALRFDIEENTNTIIEAFVRFRFDIVAISIILASELWTIGEHFHHICAMHYACT